MSRRNLIWIAVVAGIAVLFYRLAPMAAGPHPAPPALGPLVEVDGLVRRHYVEPVADERLMEGAIRGMMRKLDPYSAYVSPAEIESFRRHAAGEYIGIGVEIGMHRGQITVIAPIEDGPAVRAGIRPGDVVLAVDGVSTEELTVAEVNERLGGSGGTEVALTVRHLGREEADDVRVTRGPVSVHGVKGVRLSEPGRWDFMLDEAAGVAYVRVATFQNSTLEHFDHALNQLRERGARGLILDLRFNPGGALPAAIDIVDRFISSGVIVSTVSRRPEREGQTEEYPAHAEDTFGPVPLVVMINDWTASAAEIVAGSLQAHQRASVVGTRSFGKGSVQHLIDVPGGDSAIRLTVAYYQLPNGRVIHRTPGNSATDNWGVIPDVTVALSDSEIEAMQARRREVDGFQDFVGESGVRRPVTSTAAAASPGILLDRQLEAAVRLLALEPRSD